MARPAATPYLVGDPARASLNTRDALLLDYSEEIGYLAVINGQAGTSYTAVLADHGKIIEATNAALVTITVPASVFAAGHWFEVHARGAAGASIVQGSGGTQRPSTPIAVAQYTSRRVRFYTATEWVVE
jgi:hypothetical protein